MKKTIFPTLAALLLLSCQQTTSPASQDSAPNSVPDSIPSSRKAEYAVSKELALQSNAAYVQKMKMLAPGGSDPVRAFTVRSEDFLQLLNIDLTELPKNYHSHVRIYLGYENGNTKLYFTPVKGAALSGDSAVAGVDLYWDGPFEGDPSTQLAAGKGEYLFDFTKPCPTTCPD
jgi:hypothetical protein